ncbi:MAG: helix-turn-helix transcriptional regulator [Pseudonocardiaceae bacterium]
MPGAAASLPGTGQRWMIGACGWCAALGAHRCHQGIVTLRVYAEPIKTTIDMGDGIMAREPEELVEMRRVLGAQLAAYRQAAELSQGQLAIATTVDRTTVAHIEKGRSRADERFWTIADQRCHADGALLAGFHAWEAAKQDHEVRARQAQLAEARAKADTLRATTAPQRCLCHDTDGPGRTEALTNNTTADGAELAKGVAPPLAYLPVVGSLAEDVPGAGPDEIIGQLARLLCGWVGAMNRRGLLQLLGLTVGTTTALPVVGALNTDEQQRLAGAIASPSRVDNQVIDHLETIHRYCKQQDDALGARAVLNTVLAQRTLVHDLLAECPASLRPRLLSVYSDMSSSIGYYLFDLNEFDSSRYYYDQARLAAQDAGNVGLGVYALSEMGYTASWQGKSHTAIDLAAAAQNLANNTDDSLLRALVSQTAGVAFAVDGQYEACMVECEKAEDGLTSAGQVPAESPAYFCNEGLLARLRSECLLRLGKPREAAASAQRGLILYEDDSFVYGRALCNLHLGNAYLQSTEIDKAACAVGSAAEIAAKTRSARLVKELRITRASMQPWRNTQAVKALDDQLAAYGLVTSSAT